MPRNPSGAGAARSSSLGVFVRRHASASAPSQPDPAYRPAERDKAMAEKPSNGCSCASNNRCYHSRDFNYCVAEDGRRVYIQRYWGQ